MTDTWHRHTSALMPQNKAVWGANKCKNFSHHGTYSATVCGSTSYKTRRFELQNGPFHTVKRPVRECETGRSALPNAPSRAVASIL